MASSRSGLWGVVFSSLIVGTAGCGGAVDSGTSDLQGRNESDLIAGVDAKSATLNAIGSLVEVSRYMRCVAPPCSIGTGGGRPIGGTGGRPIGGVAGGRPIGVDGGVVIPPPPVRLPEERTFGTFDNPSWLADRGEAGAGGYGGRPSVPGTGGARPVDGGVAGRGGVTDGGMIEVVSYWPFCSATLIGPTAVLSAKHCLDDIRYVGEVAFALGPQASEPVAVYPIVDWETEDSVPSDSRMWGNGSDVGVVHLGSPVLGVTPLAVGVFDPATDVGRRFAVVGYGEQNTNGNSGTRKAGSLTLRGIGGNYADYAFGGFEGFRAMAPELGLSGASEEYLRSLYDRMALLDEYQAFLGGRQGDAQPCYGDSGGPVVALQNGVRTTYGVVTGGRGSDRLQCDFGGVFGVFGPAAKAFIDQALLWVDPCTGETLAGRCEGATAIRCVAPNEGARRISITDCDLLGQTCGLDESGTAACVDP